MYNIALLNLAGTRTGMLTALDDQSDLGRTW